MPISNPEVTFTEAELKTITRFVRQAFADRLADDQRRMLVEDFAADEPVDQRETGKVADFRGQVFQLRYAVEEALKSQLKDALTEFCGRSW